MPYIDASKWLDVSLEPTEGESYQDFMTRCSTAIKQLKPDYNDEYISGICFDAWVNHLLRHSSEVTLTITRDVYDAIYYDYWYGDWRVKEIHSATMPTLTYTSLEKAKASSGEVFKIAKSAEDEQLVFGWANIALDESGQYPLDWDGDITSPEDLEKAAYNFVLKYRATGEQHQGEIKGQLVESIMFTKEKQAALGVPDGILPEGWWVGFHVPDKEVFAKIKSGEYEMFSVEGTAKRVPATE